MPIARIAPLAGALLADYYSLRHATALTFVNGLYTWLCPGAGLGGVLAGGLLVILFAWCISWILLILALLPVRHPVCRGSLDYIVLTFLSNAFGAHQYITRLAKINLST